MKKIERLQGDLKSNQAVLIFEKANRLYFSGFNSSAGVIAITPDNAVLFIDFRYFEKAQKTVENMQVRLSTDMLKQLSEFLKNENITEIFLETDTVDLTLFSKLKNSLDGISVLEDDKIQQLIGRLRSVKDEKEIANIKAAQKITDKAFAHILNFISEGKTEREIALELEFFARKNGSDGVAFDFIVVSGKNSSLPHGVPTNKKIEKGDFITMDFGARVGGYCSDMTRTVAVGQISQKQKMVYDTVLKAQELAFSGIKAGAVCKEIDALARDYINQKGFEGKFGHGLGHSLGLDIHENPAFNTRDLTVLESGMILTVEPGIYLENEFGVRVEDMALVTEKGYENLTNSPKELIIL